MGVNKQGWWINIGINIESIRKPLFKLDLPNLRMWINKSGLK